MKRNNACVDSIQLVKASDYLYSIQEMNIQAEEHNAWCAKLNILQNVFKEDGFMFSKRDTVIKLEDDFIVDAKNNDTLVLMFSFTSL